MSTMSEWARKEIEIACKKEASDRKECEWDYGCSCYESALKAFESLCEDGHSGYSFSVTRNILTRLMNHYPLTPIEDDETWGESDQCARMSSLFREKDENGNTIYSDVDRVICIDTEDGCTFTNGFITRMIDKMFPIKMPYYPNGKYHVEVEHLSTTNDPDSFDTIIIHSIKHPDGHTTKDFIAFAEDVEGKLHKISEEELLVRRKMAEMR